ncbi:carbohydrate-binding protein [Sunxiuqinia sp. A32]|uniref:carbohydrate-binding protein n=1 Tax=Sunxiuqinia sp. A32 TaxID=3461496 RepID=UPI0040460C40
MKLKILSITATLVFVLLNHTAFSQYLHQQGKYIVDGDNNEFISRSMGLGGWMLQEGYMLETAGFAGTQHEIRSLIEESIGKDRTDEFYDAWLANHCTKKDIDSLASWGFNAVRPALHYNLFTLPVEEELTPGNDTWLLEGFKMLDDLVSWCAENEMYVFIDLHGAPGGQGKNADISDYDPSKPSLWESAENKRKTIALWRKIAQRYANNKWVGGYDLINETNWGFDSDNSGCGGSNEPLYYLMVDITNAIREVDQNHLIIIEGNCWANNMDGLFPPWDDNMAYSFHKYWSGTDVGSIQGYLDLRDEYNVPMWMGESGENSNQWFYETIQMLESQKIGWSWWPMKKISSVVGPLTVVKTDDYQQLLNTWSQGVTPESNFCYNTLMEITENLMIENCDYHPDVIDAMFRQQTENTSKPFKNITLPGTLHMVDFDMGRHDVAYHDNDIMNTKGNGGATWNNGWIYRNDGVDIEKCQDQSTKSNGFNVGWLEANEWMQYTVNVAQTGSYSLTFRISSQYGQGRFRLEADGKNITGTVSSISTSGWQNWKDVTVENIALYQGENKLKFYVEKAGFNLNYIHFERTGDVSQVPFNILNSFSSESGEQVYLAVNKHFNQANELNVSDFSILVNEENRTIAALNFDTQDSSKLVLTLDEPIRSHDVALLSYEAGNLESESGQQLASFSALNIENKTPFRHLIPGKIEAEDFTVNNGLALEDCTDIGSGSNIAYTDAGDYLDYVVTIRDGGNYQVTYRVASENSVGGKIDLQLIDSEGTIQDLHRVNVPYTQGWQKWETIEAHAELPEGEYTLRMLVNQREFNLNWIAFDMTATSANSILKSDSFKVYPNPASDFIQVLSSDPGATSNEIQIINLYGKIIKASNPKNINEGLIHLAGIPSGQYLVRIVLDDQVLTKKLIVYRP